ncbi:MAG TPA: hypothetical protein VFD58_20210 [Blastocatellia bacterium]|nr:hypothetical protein [Blastocatellia bacterium]
MQGIKRLLVTLLLACAAPGITQASGQAQTPDEDRRLAEEGASRAEEGNETRGFGFTSGVIGIVQGQTARLTVWNKGDKPALVRLQFVDEQGKVLILCNEIVAPGKAAVESFSIPGGPGGGPHRVELLAQFGTNTRSEIGLLVPTVQITDGTSNATAWMFGQEGFAEFRPVFNPPLYPPPFGGGI